MNRSPISYLKSFLVSWLWSYSFYHPRSGSVFESFTVTINLIRSAQRPSE